MCEETRTHYCEAADLFRCEVASEGKRLEGGVVVVACVLCTCRCCNYVESRNSTSELPIMSRSLQLKLLSHCVGARLASSAVELRDST